MGTRRQEQLFRDFDAWGFDHKGWSKATRKTYLGRVRYANTYLEAQGTSVFWATLSDLEGFLFKANTARSRNNTRQALVGWGEFLIHKGVRDDNPALDLPRLKEPKNLPKPIQTDEASRVLRTARALGQETYLMLLILFYTALRRQNVVELQWADISPDWKWISVQVKGRKPHQVSVHPFLRLKLQSWNAKSKGSQWVFPSPRNPNRHISAGTLYARVREVGEMAGVENFHPHRCRHTAATRMLELTSNIMVVKEFMGHESLLSTQIYALVRNPATEKAVGQFDFIEG